MIWKNAEYQSFMKTINNFLNKSVILFGAGEFGKKACSFLINQNVTVDCFCDNDPQKWHQQLSGIEIISPEELAQKDRNINIIISSSFYHEISEQLYQQGFNNVFYWPYEFFNVKSILDEIYSSIQTLSFKIHSYMYSPLNKLRIDAMNETAEYIKKNMQTALLFDGDYDGNDFRNSMRFLGYALNKVKIDGLYLEFGVYQGNTINFIAKARPNHLIYGFDSFEGLPEAWSGFVFSEGTFKLSKLPVLEENVKLIPGWFDETLPDFVKEHPEDKVAFLHVDCDLYSSTATVFEYLFDKIVKGTVIVFDEYYNYPNWQNHEYKAFQEFIRKAGLSYRYIAAGYQQVAVIIE